jgi:hypothetical protein
MCGVSSLFLLMTFWVKFNGEKVPRLGELALFCQVVVFQQDKFRKFSSFLFTFSAGKLIILL